MKQCVPVAIEGEHFPNDFSYNGELQSGQDPGETLVRMTSKQMSFPEIAQKLFRCANPQFNQLSGWLVSHDPAGEEAGRGGLGLAWLHLVCSCDAVWTYYQIL